MGLNAGELLSRDNQEQMSAGGDDGGRQLPPLERFEADGDGDDYAKRGAQRLEAIANADSAIAEMESLEEERARRTAKLDLAKPPLHNKGYAMEELGDAGRHRVISRMAGPAVASMFNPNVRGRLARSNIDTDARTRRVVGSASMTTMVTPPLFR